MKSVKKLKIVTKVLIFYIIIFLGFWSVYVLLIRDKIDKLINNDIISQLIQSGLIKNLIWTLPAICLIKHFESDMHIKLKEMFVSRVNCLKYLPIFAIFTVYILLGSFFENGKIAVSDTFGFCKIIIVLFVGLTEEIVFRGWLLNSMLNKKRKWVSILINAALFLAIHFPIWLHNGTFVDNFINLSFICIIILSIIFSISFIKSKNILVPIFLHMYWDLLMFVFY